MERIFLQTCKQNQNVLGACWERKEVNFLSAVKRWNFWCFLGKEEVGRCRNLAYYGSFFTVLTQADKNNMCSGSLSFCSLGYPG